MRETAFCLEEMTTVHVATPVPLQMSMNPDYRLDLSLGPPVRSEDLDAPLPSAMDVLREQREFFKEELGVVSAGWTVGPGCSRIVGCHDWRGGRAGPGR